MKKFCFALLTLAITCCHATESRAFDGYAYGFGYGSVFGPTFQFRNRLPTPPYFSIYPPVYYGERYERPYGASPFAALPQLHVGEDYQARPKAASAVIQGGYCASCGAVHTTESVSPDAPGIAVYNGKSVWVENPYVMQEESVAAK